MRRISKHLSIQVAPALSGQIKTLTVARGDLYLLEPMVDTKNTYRENTKRTFYHSLKAVRVKRREFQLNLCVHDDPAACVFRYFALSHEQPLVNNDCTDLPLFGNAF